MQATPLGRIAQTEPTQERLPEQFELLVQLVRQAVVPQTYAPQELVAAAEHAPAPLQPAAAVWIPFVQLALEQLVLLVGYVHSAWLALEQLPPHTDPALTHAARVVPAFVMGAPEVTPVQLPI